jgi:hypothetical protein
VGGPSGAVCEAVAVGLEAPVSAAWVAVGSLEAAVSVGSDAACELGGGDCDAMSAAGCPPVIGDVVAGALAVVSIAGAWVSVAGGGDPIPAAA